MNSARRYEWTVERAIIAGNVSLFAVSMSEFKLNEFEGNNLQSHHHMSSEGFKVADVDGDGR